MDLVKDNHHKLKNSHNMIDEVKSSLLRDLHGYVVTEHCVVGVHSHVARETSSLSFLVISKDGIKYRRDYKCFLGKSELHSEAVDFANDVFKEQNYEVESN